MCSVVKNIFRGWNGAEYELRNASSFSLIEVVFCLYGPVKDVTFLLLYKAVCISGPTIFGRISFDDRFHDGRSVQRNSKGLPAGPVCLLASIL